MRELFAGTAIGAFYAAFALHFFACDVNPPSAPTAVTASLAGEASTAQAPTPPARPPDADSAPAGEDSPQFCAALHPVRSRIQLEVVNNEHVRLFVPVVSNVEADVYVYVWLPRVNAGLELGPFPPNEWFTFAFDHPVGVHEYQLAIEGDIDGDRQADLNYQCDRHTGAFTIAPSPRPPNPPEPPSCELTRADCQDGPFVAEACACATCPEGTEWDGEECAPKCPDGDVWTDELGGRCCPALPNFPELPTWWGCTG